MITVEGPSIYEWWQLIVIILITLGAGTGIWVLVQAQLFARRMKLEEEGRKAEREKREWLVKWEEEKRKTDEEKRNGWSEVVKGLLDHLLEDDGKPLED